ncbi:39S ribosomal protein L1, mitochondrial [Leptopilina boulardi]|uniref:39S ribosomal protein L1, mitochondrial n=1 Tax=Leptopilina boulardi TaxID=63433 RepID=UPI0021F6436B|nr:39S ribosomal protein L1, mitochondrial [Leptopilina boulardi]
MVFLEGRFLSSLFSLSKVTIEPSIYSGSFLQTRNYALRKGTREKKLKQKLRNITAKRSRELKQPKKKTLKGDVPDAIRFSLVDTHRMSPDNVWLQKYYSPKVYTFEEAVQCHREVFHPTIYDISDAKLTAAFEVNMKGPSKSKMLNTFHSLVSIPHKFHSDGQKSIMVIAGTPELQDIAKNAGAQHVAGPEIIRLIKIGEMSVSDYDHIIAHPQILPQLLTIKGILKNKFPSLKQGTLGADLDATIYKHLHGVRYTCIANSNYPDYGYCEVPFGTVEMTTPQLKENFKTLLDDLLTRKPKIPEPMILRICIKCSPSTEAFKLDLKEFIKEEVKEKYSYDDDDEDDDDDHDKVTRAEI